MSVKMYVFMLFMCFFLYISWFRHIHLKTFRFFTILYTSVVHVLMIQNLTFSSCCKCICVMGTKLCSASESWMRKLSNEFNTLTNQTCVICTTPPELNKRLLCHDNLLCLLTLPNLPPHSWKMQTHLPWAVLLDSNSTSVWPQNELT